MKYNELYHHEYISVSEVCVIEKWSLNRFAKSVCDSTSHFSRGVHLCVVQPYRMETFEYQDKYEYRRQYMGKIILYLGVWAEKLFREFEYASKGCRVSISAHRRFCRLSTIVRAQPGQPPTYLSPRAICLQEWTWQVLRASFYKPLEYSTVAFLISLSNPPPPVKETIQQHRVVCIQYFYSPCYLKSL